MTVINPSANGFLRINPTGTGGGSTGNTGAATIDYLASQNRSSLVMAPVDAGGNITVGTNATVDVVFDVTGYYQPGADRWTYGYDSIGLRSTKTGPDGTTTKFSWSATGDLPLLLGEHDTGGDTWIIYGPGGQPVSQINTDNTVRWLHHDQIGSIRLTTGTTGAVTSTSSWDPYGNPTETTGTKLLLGYTGQYSDTETGLTYLRARYYDPTTNQFITRDPLVATTHEPYGYTNSNPLNATDPTGLFCVGSLCTDGVTDAIGDGWDATGGKVVSGASNFAEDPGGFAQRNRHALIDLGTGIAAVSACVTIVGCIAVAGAGLAVHVGSDQVFDDGRDISVGEAAFRSSTSALLGGANRALFGQGAVTATIGIRGGLPAIGRRGLALNTPRWVAGVWSGLTSGVRWVLSEALFGTDGEFSSNGC